MRYHLMWVAAQLPSQRWEQDNCVDIPLRVTCLQHAPELAVRGGNMWSGVEAAPVAMWGETWCCHQSVVTVVGCGCWVSGRLVAGGVQGCELIMHVGLGRQRLGGGIGGLMQAQGCC
jgi:hypothetical protein